MNSCYTYTHVHTHTPLGWFEGPQCSWRAFLGDSAVKNLPAMQEMQETQVQSLSQEEPLEEAWQPAPVPLPGEFHGRL